MQAREYPHNSDEQVREYLQAALALVDDLGPPDDLRGICLSKAIDLFSSKQVMYEQTPSALAMPQLRAQ